MLTRPPAGSSTGPRANNSERRRRRTTIQTPTFGQHEPYPARVKIVVADDHHFVRAGVKHSLGRVSQPRYEVVAEATDPTGMVAAVSRERPDVLILDVVMRGRSALEALRRCARLQPGLAIVVLTARADPAPVREAVSVGALGYVLKDAEPAELLLALGLALRGASYLAPGLAGQLASRRDIGATSALSPREREVVRLLALGHTFPEIAIQMNFSERTVKNDRARAAERLGISSRAELTRWALANGLLSAVDQAA